MTATKPPRYVRLRRDARSLGFIDGQYHTRPWWRWDCICGVMGGKYDHAEALTRAVRHAARCKTVAIADMRDRYKAALTSCEAAYAEERDRLRAELAATAEQRDRALIEAERLRVDRDELRMRLATAEYYTNDRQEH